MSREELIKCLTQTQELMVLQAIKEVYEKYEAQGNTKAIQMLVEGLAGDKTGLLEKLIGMLDKQVPG